MEALYTSNSAPIYNYLHSWWFRTVSKCDTVHDLQDVYMDAWLPVLEPFTFKSDMIQMKTKWLQEL